MATLRTVPCGATASAEVPRVCVWGRWRGRGAGEAGAACGAWPTFHNGAAAGLALVPLSGTTIHSEWVIYNKPRASIAYTYYTAAWLACAPARGPRSTSAKQIVLKGQLI